MKKIILTILVFILLISCALFERKQVISGTVMTKTNSNTMKGVQVTIKDAGISTLTDSTGFYSLTCTDLSTFKLIFTHKGYKTTIVDVVTDENKSKYKIDVALEINQ